MSIRIGLYDFFAFTLPGILYLAIIGFWLHGSGLMRMDLTTLNWLSLSFLFVLLGAGYIIGLLMDPLAYRWMRFFHGRNRDIAKAAYDKFINRHKWLNLGFDASDWGILLRAVKSKSLEAAADVEQHNVAAIMLRNISLALLLSSLSCLFYFFVINSSIWNLLLCMTFFALSIVAMRRSRTRRDWFYLSVFEAFSAHFLLDEKIYKGKSAKKRSVSVPKSLRKK